LIESHLNLRAELKRRFSLPICPSRDCLGIRTAKLVVLPLPHCKEKQLQS
jgi:hypothetical protein